MATFQFAIFYFGNLKKYCFGSAVKPNILDKNRNAGLLMLSLSSVVFLIRKEGKSFADRGLVRKRSGSGDRELFKIVFYHFI